MFPPASRVHTIQDTVNHLQNTGTSSDRIPSLCTVYISQIDICTCVYTFLHAQIALYCVPSGLLTTEVALYMTAYCVSSGVLSIKASL